MVDQNGSLRRLWSRSSGGHEGDHGLFDASRQICVHLRVSDSTLIGHHPPHPAPPSSHIRVTKWENREQSCSHGSTTCSRSTTPKLSNAEPVARTVKLWTRSLVSKNPFCRRDSQASDQANGAVCHVHLVSRFIVEGRRYTNDASQDECKA